MADMLDNFSNLFVPDLAPMSHAVPLCSRVTLTITGKNAGSYTMSSAMIRSEPGSQSMLQNALSAKAVASLKSGKHRDGEGLQFEVKGGSRRWTFNYMFEGRQRELAIGKYP